MARCNATLDTSIGKKWYVGYRWLTTKQEDIRLKIGLQNQVSLWWHSGKIQS